MGGNKPLAYDGRRYSVRASIVLWLALAGCFWIAVGMLYNLASRWGDGAAEAQINELSRIAPAAGPMQQVPDPRKR
jgi:hypothetical protein